MKNLFDVLEIDKNKYQVDIDAFWREVLQMGIPGSTHSRAKVLSLRYNKDGSIKYKYKEIGEIMGINTTTQVTQILHQAYRMIKHPRRSQEYLIPLIAASKPLYA
jgi:DNA-directed RNA polymerase sigma subunit (sigma70/sigma32)